MVWVFSRGETESDNLLLEREVFSPMLPCKRGFNQSPICPCTPCTVFTHATPALHAPMLTLSSHKNLSAHSSLLIQRAGSDIEGKRVVC